MDICNSKNKVHPVPLTSNRCKVVKWLTEVLTFYLMNFDRKKCVRCSRVFVVTELVVCQSQCSYVGFGAEPVRDVPVKQRPLVRTGTVLVLQLRVVLRRDHLQLQYKEKTSYLRSLKEAIKSVKDQKNRLSFY